MVKCPICNQNFKAQIGLDGHLRMSADPKHRSYYDAIREKEPERLMALPVKQEGYDDFLPSDRNYPPYNQRSQQPIQQQRPPTQLELMQQQLDAEKMSLELEELHAKKNRAWEDRMKRYTEKPQPTNTENQDLRTEIEQLKQKVVKLTESTGKQNVTDNPTPKKYVETEPIPGSLAWIRREGDVQMKNDLDRANENLAKYEHDKEIKELKEQLEEKDRAYKKMEEKAIEFSEYKYSPKTAWEDEDEE